MTHSLKKSKAEALSRELLEWLKIDENYLIKKFFVEKQIPFKLFKQFIQQEPTQSNFNLACDIQEVKLTEKLTDKKYATTGIQAILKQIGGWGDDKSSHNDELKLDKDTLDKLSSRFFPPSEKNK